MRAALGRLRLGPLLGHSLLLGRPVTGALGRFAAADDAKIQLAAVDVDACHGHKDTVAQAILVARAIARQRVARAIVAIKVVVERTDVHQAFGRQLEALDEEAELLDPGNDSLHRGADPRAEVFEQLDFRQLAFGRLAGE